MYNLDCLCWGQECTTENTDSCEGCEIYGSYENTLEYKFPEND